MRTLLVVVTLTAILLGLWSWIAWSLGIAILLVVRAAVVVALVFLIQGGMQAKGRAKHACRGAAIGLVLALVQWGAVEGRWNWAAILWWSSMAAFYTLVGAWAGVRAADFWRGR